MTFFYCDSHVHLSHSAPPSFGPDEKYLSVSSCHSREDLVFFEGKENLISFGIHPQIVDSSYIERDFSSDFDLLKNLLSSKRIIAIGECGFDFFTPQYKATAREQEIVFEKELALAIKADLPMILHLRKSIEKIFTYSKDLKKLPSVIFHSFPGTLMEAQSLLNHGINAYFSFGKPLLNGKKSAIACLSNLPLKNILLETDAPYQTLKGEKETLPSHIKEVYKSASVLRKIPVEELNVQIHTNFYKAFGI
ncbi:MAG: TatD family hydrolase [Treponema sp.]|nr:TatD family hydrolase [Treponema sp.]